MKQYYESEVLFQLMERDGFNIPSSVPPYESEIKAYLINQVKQAYPKLTDYEAEWLLYNYTKHLPAEFPISSVTNATSATFENVVPFAYQCAILKGQTLVNLTPNGGERTLVGTSGDDRIFYYKLPYVLAKNKKYILYYNVKSITTPSDTGALKFSLYSDDRLTTQPIGTITSSGFGKIIFTTSDQEYDSQKLWAFVRSGETTTVTYDNIMLIEYQDGMENWDIPYFEGMQSVKMPVLTTTGKNLFSGFNNYDTFVNGVYYKENLSKTNPLTSNLYLSAGEYTLTSNYKKATSFGQTIGFSVGDEQFGFLPSSSTTPDEGKRSVTFTVKNGGYFSFFISTSSGFGLYLSNIQIEKGTTATPYEPYKSNILSTSEDVELRGIGEVQDTLDCLTGEVVERIEGVVLDGSESWTLGTNQTDNTIRFKTVLQANIPSVNGMVTVICDNFPVLKNADIDVESVQLWGNTKNFTVRILKTKASTVDEFKSYLSQNPITIQYELATESVKTVDLTTVNEKGETTHFMPLEGTMNVQSSGEIIQPTFDMSVPVEATTQNLASFIDLEMEE